MVFNTNKMDGLVALLDANEKERKKAETNILLQNIPEEPVTDILLLENNRFYNERSTEIYRKYWLENTKLGEYRIQESGVKKSEERDLVSIAS